MMAFCTLFNSKYLDRGLVLYESLEATGADFILYILCMDELCADILDRLKKNRLKVIRLSEFETPQLIEVKNNRSFSEFCWTCTPLLIRYIIEEKKEPICTYLDADMFFYSNPDVLLDEMNNAGKSVMFVPHNFADRLAGKEKEVGKYCVEFNPFTKDEDSMRVLNEWIDCCIKSCRLERDGVTFGDQKYLDGLSEKYDNIHICSNMGAGMAPWNIDNYTLNDNIVLDIKGNKCLPIFFHFQGVLFGNKRIEVDIPRNTESIDYALVDSFYVPYLELLKKKRKELILEYDLDFTVDYNSRVKGGEIKSCIRKIIYTIPFMKKILRVKERVSYSS